ncbi:Tfp pilus assembly protein FimT/FimU [Planctomycetota bacterium]
MGQGPASPVCSRPRNGNPEICTADRIEKSFTLVELILVVLILAILAGIVVPRMGVDVIGKVDAETAAVQFSNYLRVARSLAIANAGTNGQGYKVILEPAEPYTSYKIVHAETLEDVKEPRKIPQGVICNGDSEFRFTGLGDLAAANQQQVQFTKGQDGSEVTVWPIGGRIRVSR